MSDARPTWPPDLLSERPATRWEPLLYALALGLLVTWDLAGRSIFHRDLPRFATIAREMIRGGDWLVPTQYGEVYANKPILYIWLVAAPSALVGDPTAFLVRLPSALALLLTALATSAWASARTGSRAAGRLAGLLVATTFFLYELGRVGRPDMLATAWGTVAAMLVDRAVLARGRPADAWLAGAALGAGLLSKGPVVLPIPLALALLPRGGLPWREGLRRARLPVTLLVALGVAAAWLVPAWLHGGDTFFRRLVVDQVSDRMAGRTRHLQPWWHYLAEFPVAALPWSPLYAGAGLSFLSARVRSRLGDAAHVLAAGVALVLLSAIPSKEMRYASVLVPPLAVAGAQVLHALAGRAREGAGLPGALRAVSAFAALVAVGSVAPMVLWPSAVPWVLPPALVLLAGGVLGWRRAAGLSGAPVEAAGRLAGVAVLVAAFGLCLYWSLLPRRFALQADLENAAVAAALEPGVPSVLLGGKSDGALDPDDVYVGAPRAAYTREARDLPTREAAPRLSVICLREQVPEVTAVREEAPAVALERPRRDGRVLVVLRFGGRAGP